jgi:hypothetical protein
LAAEEWAKLKKKDNETSVAATGTEEEGKQKKDKEASSSTLKTYNFDDEESETKIHPETTFETLKDGSTALIVKPGFRYLCTSFYLSAKLISFHCFS